AAPRPEEKGVEEVRVTRRFEAPPEAVFDAWLDESGAGDWLFATPDGEMVRVAIDARVGGRYEIIERRDGEEVLHTGIYEAIERPRRLVFTLEVPKYAPHSDRVTIDVAPAGEGAELILSQTVPEGAPASPERIEQGWGKVLDALAARLDREGGQG
ncbi:MAG TPA: SRPBCC domain-containing protein, partial [Hyphomicrobium sp.]|nr:SRPBCC domain-containing protein [Hyphomicrobium sp.]